MGTVRIFRFLDHDYRSGGPEDRAGIYFREAVFYLGERPCLPEIERLVPAAANALCTVLSYRSTRTELESRQNTAAWGVALSMYGILVNEVMRPGYLHTLRERGSGDPVGVLVGRPGEPQVLLFCGGEKGCPSGEAKLVYPRIAGDPEFGGSMACTGEEMVLVADVSGERSTLTLRLPRYA